MTKIKKSINIQAPVEDVFDYASDWQKWEEWFAGVSGFKPTTGKQKGTGARYKYKAKMLGLTVSVETEIIDFEVNKGWTGKSTKGMPAQTHWIFEPFDSGTSFTYILEYKMPVPIVGILLDKLFMIPQWNRIIEISLKNLKQKF